MILVNFDLDAICACKILQTLFRCDSIIYSIVPIRGVSDLKKAYDENSAEVNCFILINCGGTIDILEVLEPEENVIFYIIDSHRPIDVCNIYSNKQICVLGDPVDDVPEFDDIFRDDVSMYSIIIILLYSRYCLLDDLLHYIRCPNSMCLGFRIC